MIQDLTQAEHLKKIIDHTLLKVDATASQLIRHCETASAYRFAAVCIPPFFVKEAAAILQSTSVQVATVIGFPNGYSLSKVKEHEAMQALEDGADELDVVMNMSLAKTGLWDKVEKEVSSIKMAAGQKVIKVILETCYLDESEIISACRASALAGADYVKTSTGFGAGGAQKQDVALMRQTVDPKMGVKASGGIRTFQQAIEMIQAGANRLGTSCSIDIVREAASSQRLSPHEGA